MSYKYKTMDALVDVRFPPKAAIRLMAAFDPKLPLANQNDAGRELPGSF